MFEDTILNMIRSWRKEGILEMRLEYFFLKAILENLDFLFMVKF